MGETGGVSEEIGERGEVTSKLSKGKGETDATSVITPVGRSQCSGVYNRRSGADATLGGQHGTQDTEAMVLDEDRDCQLAAESSVYTLPGWRVRSLLARWCRMGEEVQDVSVPQIPG